MSALQPSQEKWMPLPEYLPLAVLGKRMSLQGL